MEESGASAPEPVKQDVLGELHGHETWHGAHMIQVVERHHPEYHPGVPLSLFDAYAERLGYDVVESNRDIERKLVDDTTWEGDDVYYRVGENVSAYPAAWHERYAESGLPGLVDRMADDMDKRESGLSRVDVVRAVGSIAGLGQADSNALLEEFHHRGEVLLEPEQNPEALVFPV